MFNAAKSPPPPPFLFGMLTFPASNRYQSRTLARVGYNIAKKLHWISQIYHACADIRNRSDAEEIGARGGFNHRKRRKIIRAAELHFYTVSGNEEKLMLSLRAEYIIILD